MPETLPDDSPMHGPTPGHSCSSSESENIQTVQDNLFDEDSDGMSFSDPELPTVEMTFTSSQFITFGKDDEMAFNPRSVSISIIQQLICIFVQAAELRIGICGDRSRAPQSQVF